MLEMCFPAGNFLNIAIPYHKRVTKGALSHSHRVQNGVGSDDICITALEYFQVFLKEDGADAPTFLLDKFERNSKAQFPSAARYCLL